MYQIFEVRMKPKKIETLSEEKLAKLRALNWYCDGLFLVKEDGGLKYVLNLSNFILKCTMGDLFVLTEGPWRPEDFPSREELVNEAISQLRALPFDIEAVEITRAIKHE